MSNYNATHNGIGIEIILNEDDTYIILTMPELPDEWRLHGLRSHDERDYAVEAMELHDAILLAQGLAEELSERIAKFPAILAAYYATQDALDDANRVLYLAKEAAEAAQYNMDWEKP